MSRKVGEYFSKFLGRKVIVAAAALLVAAAALIVLRPHEDFTRVTARSLSERLSERMQTLQGFMEEALKQPRSAWPDLEGLPEDMVVYRYVGDSLQSWCHQFPLDVEDLAQNSLSLSRSTLRLYGAFRLPFTEVDTAASFVSIGPRWYLLKSISDGYSCRVVGGLEIKNTSGAASLNGVNRRLKVPDVFSVYPLHYGDGAEVYLDGKPIMKVIRESTHPAPFLPEDGFIWIVAALLLLADFIFLYSRRSLSRLLKADIVILVVTGGLYALGHFISSAGIFSPMVYADGPVFYSLGGVLMINTALALVFLSFYVCRLPLAGFLRARGRTWRILALVAVLALLVLTFVYINVSFKSLIRNSNIGLELFKIGEVGWYTVYVYSSYVFLYSSALLLPAIVRPVIGALSGRRINFLSPACAFVASAFFAVSIVTLSAVKGLERERQRVRVLSGRMAIDRNLAFEMQLRRVENAIASDAFISSVVMENGDYTILLNRITENYLGRMSQDYDVGVYIYREREGDPQLVQFLSARVAVGTPISQDSRFVYTRSPLGRAQYTGRFLYYNPSSGLTNLFLSIDSKSEKEDVGYYAVLGSSSPGSVVLPHQYSFARYIGGKLVAYRGDYAYPTLMEGSFFDVAGREEVHSGGYVHFLSVVSDDEVIIVSRRSFGFTSYLVAVFLVGLGVFFLLGVYSRTDRRRRHRPFGSNYFKSSIGRILYLSLFGTLVVMALVSVFFVYRRNEANVMSLMTAKISTIQSIAQAGCRFYRNVEDFDTQAASQMLSEIGDYTKSDITLYTTAGKAFKSTCPEVFERMILGRRVNEEAFRGIMYENKSYFIHREKVQGRTYYAMYAPLLGSDGKMLAIICSPYTDAGLDFQAEAISHALLIITIFFILLMLSSFISGRIVDRMFSPLIEMGRKMISAREEGLEYINYERKDEISALVEAYNLMVRDLDESSKRVAQAERDKAWSEMARQVAHEIKNPLTPIKLQIQRVIRLREKGDAQWGEKFDAIAPVILESIDSLTDTANEFSTFAKLYSEEPVDIDLDKLITDQTALFSGRNGVALEYIGMQGAMISGPKPQLTRVVVNLLTNAFQAVENARKESLEKGEEPVEGRVLVSLRLSSAREEFYDVVVEDNGPGVSEENLGRLFTPNFTTKSSGTGLGLAICKNILERCGGEIAYSRSFSLGGACFTFRLPKK